MGKESPNIFNSLAACMRTCMSLGSYKAKRHDGPWRIRFWLWFSPLARSITPGKHDVIAAWWADGVVGRAQTIPAWIDGWLHALPLHCRQLLLNPTCPLPCACNYMFEKGDRMTHMHCNIVHTVRVACNRVTIRSSVAWYRHGGVGISSRTLLC